MVPGQAGTATAPGAGPVRPPHEGACGKVLRGQQAADRGRALPADRARTHSPGRCKRDRRAHAANLGGARAVPGTQDGVGGSSPVSPAPPGAARGSPQPRACRAYLGRGAEAAAERGAGGSGEGGEHGWDGRGAAGEQVTPTTSTLRTAPPGSAPQSSRERADFRSAPDLARPRPLPGVEARGGGAGAR